MAFEGKHIPGTGNKYKGLEELEVWGFKEKQKGQCPQNITRRKVETGVRAHILKPLLAIKQFSFSVVSQRKPLEGFEY